MSKVHTDYNCNAYLCRGYQFQDNAANVHVYAAGDVVTFHIDLTAAHKPGYAVSIRLLENGLRSDQEWLVGLLPTMAR